MAAKGRRDAITGVGTTGHEWDGIRELNNPLPRWWVYTFYASILSPWSGGCSSRPGRGAPATCRASSGSNQRQDLEQRLQVARAAQAQWIDRIASMDAAATLNDPELVEFAIAGGEHSFKSNCAPCHGLGGAGQGFFPTLADDDWLWGGRAASTTPKLLTVYVYSLGGGE